MAQGRRSYDNYNELKREISKLLGMNLTDQKILQYFEKKGASIARGTLWLAKKEISKEMGRRAPKDWAIDLPIQAKKLEDDLKDAYYYFRYEVTVDENATIRDKMDAMDRAIDVRTALMYLESGDIGKALAVANKVNEENDRVESMVQSERTLNEFLVRVEGESKSTKGSSGVLRSDTPSDTPKDG